MAGRFSISQMPAHRQVLLFALMIGALCYGFYISFIQGLDTETRRLKDQAASLRAEVQKAQLAESRLPEVRQQIREQEAHLNALKAVLPNSKETAEIVLRLQEMAAQNNLKMLSFAPQKTINNEFYQSWPILMAMDGTYDNLGSFFERVGNYARLINLENISIRAVENSTRRRSVSATCTATTFVLNRPASRAGGQPESNASE